VTDEIARLRWQLRALLSELDTANKPRPDVINPAGHAVPGPEWRPVKGLWPYTVRVPDPDLGPPGPPTVHVIWPDAYENGDMMSLRTDQARHLAMALLAAADWADGLTTRVTPLDRHRPGPQQPPR
jgi:hypothetical protein